MSCLALVAGAAADRIVADPQRGHPVALVGAASRRLETKIWAPSRGRGAVFSLLMVGAPALMALLVDRGLRGRPLVRGAFLASLVWVAVGGKSLRRAGLQMADHLDAGDIEAARALAPTLVGRDPASMDAEDLARAATESIAENTSDAIIGPLLWGAVAGAPGVVAYRVANTMDARVGYRNERFEKFGWASARLDDAMNLPVSRLSAAAAVIGSPFVGGDVRHALATVRRDGSAHPSPNAGRVEAAFAGALGVRLGGTNVYGGEAEMRPNLGDGSTPTAEDIRRAVRLSQVVEALCLGVCALVAWRRWR